jgi:hypothetical protein
MFELGRLLQRLDRLAHLVTELLVVCLVRSLWCLSIGSARQETLLAILGHALPHDPRADQEHCNDPAH